MLSLGITIVRGCVRSGVASISGSCCSSCDSYRSRPGNRNCSSCWGIGSGNCVSSYRSLMDSVASNCSWMRVGYTRSWLLAVLGRGRRRRRPAVGESKVVAGRHFGIFPQPAGHIGEGDHRAYGNHGLGLLLLNSELSPAASLLAAPPRRRTDRRPPRRAGAAALGTPGVVVPPPSRLRGARGRPASAGADLGRRPGGGGQARRKVSSRGAVPAASRGPGGGGEGGGAPGRAGGTGERGQGVTSVTSSALHAPSTAASAFRPPPFGPSGLGTLHRNGSWVSLDSASGPAFQSLVPGL